MRAWMLAAALAALGTASCARAVPTAELPGARLPFEVRIISWDTRSDRHHPPPGISTVGDTVTVVAPMVFPDPCRTADVDVTGAPGPGDGETTITVHIKRPPSTLRSGQSCMMVLAHRLVIVRIPGLRAGDYSVEVLAPIPFFKGFTLPAPTGPETRAPEDAVATPTQCETLSGLTTRCTGRARIG